MIEEKERKQKHNGAVFNTGTTNSNQCLTLSDKNLGVSPIEPLFLSPSITNDAISEQIRKDPFSKYCDNQLIRDTNTSREGNILQRSMSEGSSNLNLNTRSIKSEGGSDEYMTTNYSHELQQSNLDNRYGGEMFSKDNHQFIHRRSSHEDLYHKNSYPEDTQYYNDLSNSYGMRNHISDHNFYPTNAPRAFSDLKSKEYPDQYYFQGNPGDNYLSPADEKRRINDEYNQDYAKSNEDDKYCLPDNEDPRDHPAAMLYYRTNDKALMERESYFDSFHQTPQGELRNTYYNPFMIKHRRRTSKMQLRVLEKTFETNVRPDAALRKILGEQLGMTPRSVQVWFQNRRAKVKKSKRRDDDKNMVRLKPGIYAGNNHEKHFYTDSNSMYFSPISPQDNQPTTREGGEEDMEKNMYDKTNGNFTDVDSFGNTGYINH